MPGVDPMDIATARLWVNEASSQGQRIELVMTGRAFTVLNANDEFQRDDWWSLLRVLARMEP